MAVSMTNGGAQELIATGNVAACFQVMSNELATAKILLCPQDFPHDYATNFDTGFSRTNISYFIGLKATESVSREILSGDDNLVLKGRVVTAGIVDFGTNAATWTSDRHQGSGNALMTDGSVQDEREISCSAATGSYFVTNNLAIP
jgi:prepilin-type processing-associated H-X9-DG protein